MDCDSSKCTDPAVCSFVWPASKERAACLAHARHAQRVAEALGFELVLFDPGNLMQRRAAEAVARLEE